MFLACLIQDQSATQVESVENEKGLLIRGLTVTADAAVAHKTLSQGLRTSIHPKHKPLRDLKHLCCDVFF